MKKLSKRVLLFAAACSLMAAPALAEVAEDVAPVETVIEEEFDLPDTIIIEEEEVPLAALPLMTASTNAGFSAQALTTAGVLMMGLSAVGLVWTRISRLRENSDT